MEGLQSNHLYHAYKKETLKQKKIQVNTEEYNKKFKLSVLAHV